MSATIVVAISLTVMISIDLIIYLRGKKKEEDAARKEDRRPNPLQKYVALAVINIAITASCSITVINMPKKDDGPKDPPPAPEQKDDVESLRQKMSKKYEGDGFKLEPRLDTQVIKDQIGNYYDLYIKGPSLFQEGEYIIEDAETAYSEPLKSYIYEINDILEKKHIDHKLYVKGSADYKGQLSFKRDFKIDRWTFREIPYLLYDRQQKQFTQGSGIRRIPGPYTNSDLPDLRARFTQEVLKGFRLSSSILEGDVTTNLDNPMDRHITFLLYVRWPDKP